MSSYYFKKPTTGGGEDLYHKTIAKLVETDDNKNVQSKVNEYDNHIKNESNPHKVTLSQLGYNENELFKRFMNIIYPINCIKITYTNENPGAYLPGTWMLVSEGRYLKGATSIETYGTTGGSSSVNINHSHSLPNHAHSISAHSHVISSHAHSVPSHRHLQTVGADDINGFYYYYPPDINNQEYPSMVVSTTRAYWGHASTHGRGTARFNYTETSAVLTSGYSGDMRTTDTSLTTAEAGLSTYSACGDISIDPLYLTVFIWRRIS